MGFVPVGILLLLYLQVPYIHGDQSQAAQNKNHIERQQKILEEAVKDDLLKTKEKFNKLANQTKIAMKDLRSYIDKALIEFKDHVGQNLNESDATINNNTDAFDSYVSDKFDEMNQTMLENLDKFNQRSAEERNGMIDWSHKRNHHNEDILKTSVALCVYDHAHRGRPGEVVSYNSRNYNSKKNSGYVDGKIGWRVFNATAPEQCCFNQQPDCEACAMKVLNRVTGVFTVPNNASGLYMFTFTVTMDVYSHRRGLQPAEYQFRKNKHLISGSKIFSNTGYKPKSKSKEFSNDKAPGSKTIFLDLSVGDEVDVVELLRKTVLDVKLSFCGVLLHLTEASTRPGGEEANVDSGNFPLVDPPHFQGVDFDFAEFNNYTLAYNDFEFETNKTMFPLEEIEGNAKIEENDLRIDNFVNYCTEGLSDDTKCKKGSTRHGSG